MYESRNEQLGAEDIMYIHVYCKNTHNTFVTKLPYVLYRNAPSVPEITCNELGF